MKIMNPFSVTINHERVQYQQSSSNTSGAAAYEAVCGVITKDNKCKSSDNSPAPSEQRKQMVPTTNGKNILCAQQQLQKDVKSKFAKLAGVKEMALTKHLALWEHEIPIFESFRDSQMKLDDGCYW